MASTFKVKTHRLIGASATTVNAYTVGSSTATTVIGLNGKDTFLIKSAPIPSGGSLVVVGGDQKVVLQNAHSVKCVSNTAVSLDVVMSILEIT